VKQTFHFQPLSVLATVAAVRELSHSAQKATETLWKRTHKNWQGEKTIERTHIVTAGKNELT
jgi:hypothetical protein